MEQALQQFRDAITSATSAGKPLRIRGGGTKDWYGQTLQGDILDTREYSGIIAYDPTEEYTEGIARETRSALEQRGATITAFEPIKPGQKDYSGVVNNLSATNPDAIYAAVYAPEGAVIAKISGQGEEKTYTAGQMFYEQPGATHEVSKNASQTQPARLLAMIFAKKGSTLTTPA